MILLVILVPAMARGFLYLLGGFYWMERTITTEKSIGVEEGEHTRDDQIRRCKMYHRF